MVKVFINGHEKYYSEFEISCIETVNDTDLITLKSGKQIACKCADGAEKARLQVIKKQSAHGNKRRPRKWDLMGWNNQRTYR